MHPSFPATNNAASAHPSNGASTYSMDGTTLHHSHRSSMAHHHVNVVSNGLTDTSLSKLPPYLHVHSHHHQHQQHVSPPSSPSSSRRTRPPAPGRTSRRRATAGHQQLPSPSSEAAPRRCPSNDSLASRDVHARSPVPAYTISSTTMDKLQHTLTYQESSRDSAAASCKPETCVYYQQLLLSAEIGQELLHKYTAACTDLDSLKTSSSVLDAELATLRSTNDQLAQQNAMLTSDLDAAKSQVATLESTLADSQSAHALAMSAVQAQQVKFDASEKEWSQQVKAAEHEVTEVRAKLERAEARARELKDGYSQVCQDRDAALARAADSESTNARLESELAALRATIDEAAVVDSPTSPDLSKHDVSLLLATLADLQSAHDQLQSQHTDLLAQFRQVQDDLAHAREEHAAAAATAQPMYDDPFDSDVSAWLLPADTPGSSTHAGQTTVSVSLGNEMAAAAAAAANTGSGVTESMSFALAVGGSSVSQKMTVDAWAQCDQLLPEITEKGISSETINQWVKQMHQLVDSAHVLRARILTADPASIRRSRSATPVSGESADWSWDDLCTMGHEVLDTIQGELSKLVSVTDESTRMHVSHVDHDDMNADEALAFSASHRRPPTAPSFDDTDDQAHISESISAPPASLGETKSTIQSLLHALLTDAIAQQRSAIDTSRAYVAIVDAKAAEFSRQVQLEHEATRASLQSVGHTRVGSRESPVAARQRVRTSDSQRATATSRARSPLASGERAPAETQSVSTNPARGRGGAMGGQQPPTPVKKSRARLFGVF